MLYGALVPAVSAAFKNAVFTLRPIEKPRLPPNTGTFLRQNLPVITELQSHCSNLYANGFGLC